MNGITVTVDQATVQGILEKEQGFSALNLGHIAKIAQYVTENLSGSKALAELVSDQVMAELEAMRENDPQLAQAAYMDELRDSCRSTLFAAGWRNPSAPGTGALWVKPEDMEWVFALDEKGFRLTHSISDLRERWPGADSLVAPSPDGGFDAVRFDEFEGIRHELCFATPEAAAAFCSGRATMDEIDDYDAIVSGDWDRFDGNPEKLAAAKQVAEELRENNLGIHLASDEPQVDKDVDKGER